MREGEVSEYKHLKLKKITESNYSKMNKIKQL